MLLTLATPLTSPDRFGSMREGVLFAAGSLLVIVALADLVLATLSGRRRFGVYSGPICHSLWRLLRAVSRLSPAKGHPILNAAGPLMLVVVLALWVAVPTLGFSLMILPGLDGAFVIGGGQPIPPPSRHIGTALYISGFSFTTLGAGPFVPQSNGYRALIVVQAAIGFATFTLAITYCSQSFRHCAVAIVSCGRYIISPAGPTTGSCCWKRSPATRAFDARSCSNWAADSTTCTNRTWHTRCCISSGIASRTFS
jgi:hypothetical protein